MVGHLPLLGAILGHLNFFWVVGFILAGQVVFTATDAAFKMNFYPHRHPFLANFSYYTTRHLTRLAFTQTTENSTHQFTADSTHR